ncbi:MAG: hypothetical protein E8D45_03345 [Nitrospira sp.]|nr:MAG: hypothetical protein E8D45_03345 [Nitrospira sp.]
MRTTSFGTILLLVVGIGGCGNVGPPIPPENVGIRAKVLRAQEQEKKAAQAQTEKPTEAVPPVAPPVPEGASQDEIQLPPYRPVGTR